MIFSINNKRISKISDCKLCALAHILLYVTSAHIRVFMRTLESNLKRSKLP